MGIEMGREMGIERQQKIRKNGQKERERERAHVKGLVEENNKKIEKIDYLNKRDDKINKLMWVFCKNRYVKQKKVNFQCKNECVKYTN